MSAACVCGWLAGKGEERKGERGRGGRLLELIEIKKIEDKMPKENARSNIGWISTGNFQTFMVANYPSVCDAT